MKAPRIAHNRWGPEKASRRDVSAELTIMIVMDVPKRKLSFCSKAVHDDTQLTV